MGPPLATRAPHIELVEVYKEEVVTQVTAPTATIALHVVVVLEHVVVYKQRIAHGDGAVIAQGQRNYLALPVGKAMVLFVGTNDEVSFGICVSLSPYNELLYCPQKLILYSTEIGIGDVNSFQSTITSSCSMKMR